MDTYEVPSEEFKHTVPELQDAINKSLVQNAKVHACVDWFLKRLANIKRDNGKGYIPLTLNFDSYKGKGAQRLGELAKELESNLRRLVPDYLGKDADVLKDEKLHMVLRERSGGTDPFYPRKRKRDSPESDLFRGSLLPTLMENNCRRRLEPVEGEPKQPQLSALAFTEICRHLKESVEGQRASASFACGGTIPIGDSMPGDYSSESTRGESPPVSLLWATGQDSKARKLVLPLNGAATESSQEVRHQLVADCDPATFGRGDQDILDPEYRKAGKIDPHQFASSFHPSDFSIIENIEQILLPSVSTEKENRLQFRKLSAELYKLNAYSGPSGLFRKHVDTPRAKNQVGSLVVCLPSAFKGGNLLVQHHGQTVEFNWSTQSGSKIQWAAFYSDCEHEIKKITEGDRITLTYNLYVTEPVGRAIPSKSAIVEPETLPLYSFVRDTIAEPGFMKTGGVLGIFCAHAYPYTSEVANIQLPRALKGSDLVLYSVFKSLGMEVDVLPVLERQGKYAPGDAPLGINGCVERGRRSSYMGIYDSYNGFDEMSRYLAYGEDLEDTGSAEILPPGTMDRADVDRRWKLLLMARQSKSLNDLSGFLKEKGLSGELDKITNMDGARVGTHRRPYFTTDSVQDEFEDVANTEWPAYHLPGITWITDPKHEERAFSQISYGNEASIGTRYSCAAILAVVPSFDKRG